MADVEVPAAKKAKVEHEEGMEVPEAGVEAAEAAEEAEVRALKPWRAHR